MTAYAKDCEIQGKLYRRYDVFIQREDANTLRRAEMTLHRWAEEECNGTIERNDATDVPYRVVQRYTGNLPPHRWAIPDRENGALRRVKALCKRLGLHWYYQTDPRGCALYVASLPLNDQNYSSAGVACSAGEAS